VPDECPAAEVVGRRARSLAGVSEADWAVSGSVRGRIVAEASDWVLSLEIVRAPSGGQWVLPAGAAESDAAPAGAQSPARVFRAGDCGELAEAAAVAIALALGGTDAPAPSAAEPARTGSAAASPASGEARDEANGALASESELRSLGAIARAEALVDTASLGGLALGAAAEVGVRWPAIALCAYGLGLPSRQVHLVPSQWVELSLWAAGLRGCYRAVAGVPLVDVCAGAEVGAFGAAGRGLADARARRDVWGATTWGTWFGVALAEHLQAGARFEAVLPLTRERYLVNSNDVVHQMSGGSLRMALSLGGTLGSD
jgi:hypothetical protein